MSLKGKTLVDVQNMNRSLVLQIIQKQHRTSRVEISKLTGLNKATVTNIVGDLIAWGAVRESGLISGEGGRRSIAIELAVEDFAIIGLWITRRSLHLGICNMYGECDKVYRYDIGVSRPADEVVNTICDKIEMLARDCDSKKILGVAMAVPGPLLKEEDRIALITDRNEWQNVAIIKEIKERIPYEMIVEHDSDAYAMAEWCYTENYDEKSSIVSLSVGYGVGGSVIEDGKILHGSLGGGGEIGHMSINYRGIPCECGNIGCLEKYCSATSVFHGIREQLSEYPDTCCREDMSENELFDAYLGGDELARKVIDESAKYLGYGIANIINIFLPGKIIIGDVMSQAGERYLELAKASAKGRVLPVLFDKTEIILSSLKDTTLKGVCLTLAQKAVEEPERYFYLDSYSCVIAK